MAGRCEICNKFTTFGHNVSHSNKKTRRAWKVNIIKVKYKVNGRTKTIKVCAKCYKAGKHEEYIKKLIEKESKKSTKKGLVTNKS